jgi:hypothetical protein
MYLKREEESVQHREEKGKYTTVQKAGMQPKKKEKEREKF